MANDIWISPSTTNWSTAGNWSLAAIPVNTNDVYLAAADSNVSIDAGLAQSGVTLNSFNQDMSYTGTIGTVSSYLNIGATTFNLGIPAIVSGNGSRRMNINAANSGAIINVQGSGQTGVDAGFPPVRLLCTAAVLNVTGGFVGVAVDASETSSIATLNIENGFRAPAVILGTGVTLTTATVLAGTLTSKSAAAVTTMKVQSKGIFVHLGTGGFTTLTAGAGCTVTYDGSGTIATLNVLGKVDFSGGTAAVTVTNCNVYAGGQIIDPLKRITFTNPLALIQCKITDVNLDLGYARNVQVS